MVIHFVIFVMSISGAVNLWLTLRAFQRRRESSSAGWLAGLMGGVSLCSFAYSIEMSLESLELMRWTTFMAYIGLASIPVCWFGFAMTQAGKAHYLTRTRTIALFVLPLAVLIAIASNPMHFMFYREVSLAEYQGFFYQKLTPGILWWINLFYSYALLLAGFLLMLGLWFRVRGSDRERVGYILAGFIFPVGLNFCYSVLGLRPAGFMDLTPLGFAVMGLLCFYGVFRLRLFDVFPLAMDVLFEHMPGALFILDKHDLVVNANPAGEALLDDPDFQEKCVVRTRNGRGDLRLEINTQTGEQDLVVGSRIWNVRAMEIKLGAGHLKGYLAMFQDVTERKQAEERLKASEMRFQAILENVKTVAVQGYAMDGTVTYWNHASQHFYGYTEQEALGRNLLDLIVPPDSLKEVEQAIDSMRISGEAVPSSEINLMRKDGSLIPVYSSHALVHVPGRETELFCIDVDLSARKRAEEALERSRMELQAIYESAPIMLCLVDEERRVLNANRAFAAFVGKDEDDLGGGLLCEVLGCIAASERQSACGPGEACARCGLMDALDKTLETGESCTGIEQKLKLEIDGVLKDVVLLGATAPLRSNSGNHALLCLADITENRSLSAQLAHSQKMESVGRLAGGVAHDFNNMLQVILGYTDILMESIGEEEKARASLEEIGKSAKRSRDLTRQLLTFARRQVIDPKVLDLNELVEAMLNMLRRLIGENIEIEWRPSSESTVIRMDPSQIDQMVVNLCVNARDAISGSGRIMIATGRRGFSEHDCGGDSEARPGNYVLLQVSDDGAGMSEEVLGQLFEPFFTTKGQGKGVGLGLATVYGAVKQNGGFIDVDSKPGEGTTFSVYIPANEAEAEPDHHIGKGGGETVRGSATVLLVEDEDAVREMTEMYLESLGYEVISAEDGQGALKVSEEYSDNIDLLLTDMVMPGMSGVELAKSLRIGRPGIKVVYMSGYSRDMLPRQDGVEEDFAFISKPFDRSDLSQILHDVLSNS